MKRFFAQKIKFNKLIIFIFCVCILSGTIIPSENIPPKNHSSWNILQEGDIWVGWTQYENSQWCKARGIINAPIENISKLIENKVNYPNVFKRVESATPITEYIIHIVLDMPFPFYGRDYIVSYSQLTEDGELIYRFKAVKNSGIPVHEDYVRLINAEGEWRLLSLDEDNTEVTYSWNGELLGDFPHWALPQAWETQGVEVLNWLKDALNE
tara:strand:- start:2117 stop:2749 length:633 start_codon:yes stop_codon:yes gene_type:complete